MEDKDFQELFSAFKPGLSSDYDFMKALDARLEAVEMIKEWQAVRARQRRVALVAAAFSGVLIGGLLAMVMPSLLSWLSGLCADAPSRIRDALPVATWAAAGLLSVVVAANAYSLTMALNALRHR